MTSLQKLLDSYRQAAVTEREKGTYFEELILCYLRNEASYRDLYSDVWTYSDWAKLQGLPFRPNLIYRRCGHSNAMLRHQAQQCCCQREHYLRRAQGYFF